jgi:hypothetical protein
MTQYVNTDKYEALVIQDVEHLAVPRGQMNNSSRIVMPHWSIEVNHAFIQYYKPRKGDYYMAAENGEDIVVPKEVFEEDYKEVA